ncbi:unnamed protein product [Ectocarpus fasciculatus]
MNALLLVLAVTHQQYAAAFMVRPQAAPSLASGEPATCTSTSSLGGGLHVATDVSTRPRAAYTRLRSRQDVAPSGTSGDGDYSREEEQPEDAADVDVERLMSSLESSDLFGGGGATGGEGEGGGGGGGGWRRQPVRPWRTSRTRESWCWRRRSRSATRWTESRRSSRGTWRKRRKRWTRSSTTC